MHRIGPLMQLWALTATLLRSCRNRLPCSISACAAKHLRTVCCADLAEEDQDGEEGVGPLTQLLGPDRHTALELKKAGIKWKTKQKEGSVPGQEFYCSV